MEDRGRLAQPLKPKQRRWFAPKAQRARATFAWSGKLQRLARRWLTPIVELKVPRGAGSIAAAALMLASAGYGVVKGGHAPAMAAEMQNLCDAAANGAGLRIASIALAGNTQLSRADILTLAGVSGRSSLLCLDAASARAKLMNVPWIADASVLKLYPGRLQVEIKERQAIALWQKDGQLFVIADDGTVLERFDGRRFAALPLVVGAGAERAAQDFLVLLARYPAIRAAVVASVLVAERRWNLRLTSGIDVRLPETDVEAALQTLVKLAAEKKLLSRDIAAIDLRLSDRVTVRLSDAAAQARAEAIKESQKDKKAKRKGSDA